MAVAWGAAGAGAGAGGAGGEHLEPWNYRHLKLSRTSNDSDDLHQDYDLRSVVSFRHSAAAAPPPPLLMHHAPVVVAPAPAPAPSPSPSPARSWVDPLIFLLKKELTVTDVGDLGRIILPKRDAECQLPRLDHKEGKMLTMEDYNSNKKWTLRYKWWPNNKSRMYVLESTGDFVKYHELREKDEFVIYKDATGTLVVRGLKYSSSPLKGGGSFHAGGFKGVTPTGKRSPKGRSNLSKSCTNAAAAAAATTTTTTTTTNAVLSSTTTAVLTTSVFTASYGGVAAAAALSVEPVVTLVGPSSGPCGPAIVTSSADGSAIEWEKLPDPPAIEFSDPPAIEFPEEFECSWGESF